MLYHNERYTLKMEDQYGEVNYKLGQQDSWDINNLPSLIEQPEIKETIVSAFGLMRTGRDILLTEVLNKEDFRDEII